MKQTWSDSLDFDAFTSQKKLAKSKVQLIFKCWLWWIQAVQKHSHDSHRPEILTSSQPFHPEATYCGKDPEDICHPGYPSECDIVRHHVTHPQMAQVFPRKIFLKKHPSENILWSIRNHWLVRLVMNELVKRLHANYWAKNAKKKRLLRPWNPGWTGYSNGICSNLSRNIDSWNLKPSKSVHQVSWLIMWMSKNVQKKNPRKVVPPKLHQNAARNCRRNIMPIAIKSSKELEVRFFIRLDDIRVFFRLEGSQFNDGMAPSNQPPTSRFVSSNWTI